jgi:polyhydroxyalkanoate synthesis regulator phasin
MVESLLKKALLFQAEIVSMASEKVQEVATSYVEKGTLHDADAKKFVSEVREKLLTTEKDFEEKFGKVSKMVQDMGFALKNSVAVGGAKGEESLDEEIDGLEKKLEELKIKKEMAEKK